LDRWLRASKLAPPLEYYLGYQPYKAACRQASSETMRPAPLIYWAPSRLQAATSVAKQTPCWWSSWTGGHGPPNWLQRCNNFKIIKRSKAACRQVPLQNAETSTIELLGSKQAPGSHICGKADTLLAEILDGYHGPPNWLHRCNNF